LHLLLLDVCQFLSEINELEAPCK